MAANDFLFREAGILPVAHLDLIQVESSTQGPRTELGSVAWFRDKFGYLRMATYRKNISGSAFAASDLVSRKRETETNQTGTATTSLTGAFTANDYVDGIIIIHDDAGAAGGAPEGEATVVASNTATVATFHTDLPLSVALAANDDATMISLHVIDAADGDLNITVCGVAMGAAADGGFGWFQFQGFHPRVQHKTTDAVTAGNPVVADAAAVGAHGTDVANLWVGYQVTTHGGDALQIKSPVVMSLLPVYV
jgi:hypothetical protein